MSAHSDYLDPDTHLWPAEDYGFDKLQAALKARSTCRWQWDELDCCWTGKDADLDRGGHQGCRLVSVNEEHATVEVHAGKTFVGYETTLNLPRLAENNHVIHDKVLDIYLEQAAEIVCGCGVSGEWDGDSWWMTARHTIKVPVVASEDESELDADETAAAIVTAAEKSLADWEREIGIADDMLDLLAGWKKYNRKKELVDCKPGRPGTGSAWWMYRTRPNQSGKQEDRKTRP